MLLQAVYFILVKVFGARFRAKDGRKSIKTKKTSGCVKRLLALSFVPINDIIEDFDLVAAEFDNDSEEFTDYFEKTWIGEPKREVSDIL